MYTRFIMSVFGVGLLACSTASASTIAEIAALPEGSEVTISECVITATTDFEADSEYRTLYVRDHTRGVCIYGKCWALDPVLATYSVGAVIEISGVTAQRNGALALVEGSPGGFAIGGISAYGPPPVPWPIAPASPSELAQYESDLVCLQNVSFDSEGVFAAGGDYSVAGGMAQVRIATADVGLDGSAVPTGPVNITGIIIPSGLDDGTYRLAPRGLGDIVPVPEPATLSLLVLGAAVLRRRFRK